MRPQLFVSACNLSKVLSAIGVTLSGASLDMKTGHANLWRGKRITLVVGNRPNAECQFKMDCLASCSLINMVDEVRVSVFGRVVRGRVGRFRLGLFGQ